MKLLMENIKRQQKDNVTSVDKAIAVEAWKLKEATMDGFGNSANWKMWGQPTKCWEKKLNDVVNGE